MSAKTTPIAMTAISQADLLERLRAALGELRLPEAARALESEIAAGPNADDSRLGFLWRIIEPQQIARRQRSVKRRVDLARLPALKSLDEFDFLFQPTLDRDRVLELATLDFVRRGENLLLAGMSGTGKSHIAIALGHLACARGMRTRYTTSAEMLAELHASLASHSLNTALRAYLGPELLVIDELGLERPERHLLPDAQLLYKVVRPRYENTRSTIITSNIDWEKWGEYLGDEVASVAILDRLIEHGHLLTIHGPSYRAHRHSRLNAAASGKPKQEPSPPQTRRTDAAAEPVQP